MSKILKSLIIYIFILILALPVFAGFDELPHPVRGTIDNKPSVDNLSFYAYMDGREDEILLGESALYNHDNGVWTIDVANFDTSYSLEDPADIVNVVLVNKNTKKHLKITHTLTFNIPDDYLPPITLGGIVPQTPDLSGDAEPGQVVLTWVEAPGATGYDILRSDVPGGPVYYRINNDVDIVNSPYIDSYNIKPDQTYYYLLIAKNGEGSGAYSNEESVTVSLHDLVSITLDPANAILEAGELETFSVTAGCDIDGDHTADCEETVDASACTWQMSDGASGILSLNGVYTAPSPDELEENEVITITAALRNHPSISDIATVNLTAPELQFITVYPTEIILPAGASREFTVTATFKYGEPVVVDNDNVTWIVPDGDGKIDGNTYTAPLNINEDKEIILTCRYTHGGVKSENTLTITVTPDLSEIDAIEANIDPSVVRANEESTIITVAMDATGNPVSFSDYDLEYFYSVIGPDGIAHENLINEDGIFTPGEVEGTYTITVTLSRPPSPTLGTDVDVEVDLGPPTVKSITVDGKEPKDDMIMGSKPRFEITLSDGNGIDTATIKILLDDSNDLSFSSQVTVQHADATAVSYSLTLEEEIPAGIHTLTIEFEDGVEHKGSVKYDGIKVYNALSIVGITRNYPNPFKPSVGTTLLYELTQDASVKIYIYDLAGRLVYSTLYEKGTLVGGSAGENPVPWDGKNTYGEYVANGVYVYFLLSAEGKILDRGEMACYE